mgnify:CR=1 FL=1
MEMITFVFTSLCNVTKGFEVVGLRVTRGNGRMRWVQASWSTASSARGTGGAGSWKPAHWLSAQVPGKQHTTHWKS